MRARFLATLWWVAAFGLATPANGQLDIPMVVVDNPRRGGVFYSYRSSVYEVTNAQFAIFLNAVAESDPLGLYDERMATDPHGGITRSGTDGNYVYTVRPNFADKPVNYLRWSDTIRLVNWLHNGQPEGPQGPGTTEDGAYVLFPDELDSYFFTTREPHARWALPSKEEWKKAGRYDPTKGGSGGFWRFATRSDDPPAWSPADATGNLLNPGPNVVNHARAANWNGSTDGNVTTVGSAGPQSASYYGTSDQNGNVGEWTQHRSCVGRYLCGRDTWGGNFETGTGGTIHPLTYGLAPLADYLNPDLMPGHLTRGPRTGFRVVQLCPRPLPGDLTEDGRVDLIDLLVFLPNYGAGDATVSDGDLDCDGDVDLSDLGTLLSNFGKTLD